MLIAPGPSVPSGEIAEGIARLAGLDLVKVYHKVFPDGERYVRIDSDVAGEDVLVVQSLSPPQDSSLVEAMLLADALLGAGARHVGLLAPYLAYSRQDRRFLPGEPVSIEVILRALWASGYRSLYTVEAHKKEPLSKFPGRAESISPYKYMAERIGLDGGDYLVLAPDLGALERAREFAEAVGAPYDYLVKRRDRVTGEVRVEPKDLPVNGKKVVIVDDIISTGGTVARATRLLLEQGAVEVFVVVAHALLVGGAPEKLRAAGVSRVYAANTLPRVEDELVSYIDIAPLLAEYVKGKLAG